MSEVDPLAQFRTQLTEAAKRELHAQFDGLVRSQWIDDAADEVVTAQSDIVSSAVSAARIEVGNEILAMLESKIGPPGGSSGYEVSRDAVRQYITNPDFARDGGLYKIE